MQFPGLINEQEYIIKFLHVLTEQRVQFEGWVTSFSDQYNSTWNETPVYGRMDPLATFQRTGRQLTVGFDVVAANAIQARDNLKNISKLVQFLYPTYTDNTRSLQNTLSGGPLLGFQWTNLAGSKQRGGGASDTMLYGYTSGLTYAPNVADGGFLSAPGVPSLRDQATKIAKSQNIKLDAFLKTPAAAELAETTRSVASVFIPKTVSLNFAFTVLHTHLMGWNDGKFGGNEELNNLFPYMSSVPTNASPPDGAPAAEGASTDSSQPANPNQQADQNNVGGN